MINSWKCGECSYHLKREVEENHISHRKIPLNNSSLCLVLQWDRGWSISIHMYIWHASNSHHCKNNKQAVSGIILFCYRKLSLVTSVSCKYLNIFYWNLKCFIFYFAGTIWKSCPLNPLEQKVFHGSDGLSWLHHWQQVQVDDIIPRVSIAQPVWNFQFRISYKRN